MVLLISQQRYLFFFDSSYVRLRVSSPYVALSYSLVWMCLCARNISYDKKSSLRSASRGVMCMFCGTMLWRRTGDGA